MEADPRRVATLSRRRLLRLSALAGAGMIAGCDRGPAPRLLYSRGDLPAAWLKRLPAPWQAQASEGPADLVATLATTQQPLAAGRSKPGADLLQLPDGWLADLAADRFQPFTAAGTAAGEALFHGLAPFARPVSQLFDASKAAAPLAYPWAFGTWVLLLRNRPDLRERRSEGWDLLLDPGLHGKLVLPSSPRVVIELALRQLALRAADPTALDDPRLKERLVQLRRQALAFDDRDGLNLLLRGPAEAAVLPSQRVLPLLRSDSRLTALLPTTGSPLWWSLLLRPAGSREPAPLAWVRQLAEPALLSRLFAAGWVPPLPHRQLAQALDRWPKPVADLLYPPEAELDRCTSLPPLAPAERRRYQRLWDATA